MEEAGAAVTSDAARGAAVLVDVSAVSKPDDLFRCDALRAQMTGRLCATRHLAKRNINGKIRDQPEYPGCAGCQLGAGVAQRVGDLSKLPPRPPPRPIARPTKAAPARVPTPQASAPPEPARVAPAPSAARRVRLPIAPAEAAPAEAAPAEAAPAEAAPAGRSRRRKTTAAAETTAVETKAPSAPQDEGATMSGDGTRAGRMSAERAALLRSRVESACDGAPGADVGAVAKAVRDSYKGAGEHPPTLSTVRRYVIRARGGSTERTDGGKAARAAKTTKHGRAKAAKAKPAGTELARVPSGRLPSASASWAGSMQLARAQHNIEEMIEVFPDGDRRIIIANLIVKFGVGFGG